jgi:DNA-binding transcriptional regulator of glucitol operon
MEVPKVYAAVSAVTGELAAVGIAKDRKTTGGSVYAFRGIDDVYNALAGLLARHKLCIFPSIKSVRYEDKPTKNGGMMVVCYVEVNFKFVSAEDGSFEYVSTLGEAMDTSDKSSNKAMSAAMKYAALMAFCIPVQGGMVDSEVDDHKREQAPAKPDAPTNLTGKVKQESPKDDERLAAALIAVAKAKTVVELDKVAADWGKDPPDILLAAFETKDLELQK